jgi:hypothetical protein
MSITDVRDRLEAWRRHYNAERSDIALEIDAEGIRPTR